MPEGSSVYIQESGADVEFVVAKHGYEPGLNGLGRTLLIRKEPLAETVWNQTHVNTYDGSSIDRLLKGDYANRFSDTVKSAMGLTSFYYTVGGSTTEIRTLSRSVFLPSIYEMFDPEDKNADVYVNGSNPFFKKKKVLYYQSKPEMFLFSLMMIPSIVLSADGHAPLHGEIIPGIPFKASLLEHTVSEQIMEARRFSIQNRITRGVPTSSALLFTLPSTTKVGNDKKILL